MTDVTGTISENFYKIDFSYYEPLTGQVVWTAPSEEEAVAGLLEAIPAEVRDFKVMSIVLVDADSDEGKAFAQALSDNRKQLN